MKAAVKGLFKGFIGAIMVCMICTPAAVICLVLYTLFGGA